MNVTEVKRQNLGDDLFCLFWNKIRGQAEKIPHPSYLLTGEGDYFLTTSKTMREPVIQEKSGDIYKDSIAEMVWYLDNIPLVGFQMLVYFNQFLKENKDLIDLEVKKIKEKNPKAEIPIR